MTSTRRLLMLAAGFAAAVGLAPTTLAAAERFARITSHDEFDSTNDCGNGPVSPS